MAACRPGQGQPRGAFAAFADDFPAAPTFGGTPLVPASGIAEARRRCAAGLAALPGSARRIHAPGAPVCEPSAQVRALHAKTVAQLADEGRATAVTRREQEPGA